MKLVKLSNISYDDDNIIISESNIDDLMNDLAEYDDNLVDDYLNGTITRDMILNRIFELSKKGSLCVVLGGTALKGIGTKQLFNHFVCQHTNATILKTFLDLYRSERKTWAVDWKSV